MNDLIKDLRNIFSDRYEAPLSEAILARYEKMKLKPDFADALVDHPAALRQNTLLERGRLVKTISKYLDDPYVWTVDAAKINLVSKKRKR